MFQNNIFRRIAVCNQVTYCCSTRYVVTRCFATAVGASLGGMYVRKDDADVCTVYADGCWKTISRPIVQHSSVGPLPTNSPVLLR